MATQPKGYSTWTDADWNELLSRVRATGVPLKDDEIRQAAWTYMHVGADGGGNEHGVLGTLVALEVDKFQQERCNA